MSETPISQVIAQLAAEDPDAPMLTEGDRTVTRREFEQHTNRLARAYAALGVTENSLVSIIVPNGIEFYEACHAAWKLGATPQMASYRLPKAELDAIIELADPSLVVGEPEGTRPERPSVPAGFQPDPTLDDSPLPVKVAKYWRAPTSGGSTGRPKIILSNVPATTDPDSRSMKMSKGGAILVPGPLYHSGPFLFSMLGLWRGKHVVIMKKFNQEETLQLIEKHKVDYVQVVPTMMNRIWMLGDEIRNKYDLSSLKVVLHFGSACAPWLKQGWIEWLGGDRIYELYAGAEAQGMTWINGNQWLEHKGSVGRPIQGCEMCIMDEEGNQLPPGEVGEIYMRQPGAAKSYEYIGADSKANDGWDSLGDMGYMDEDGYLYIADRRTDMIISGGANIYPAEVEAALDEHPAVLSSAVIGLPDDDLGHKVHVIYHADAAIDEDVLREHMNERLALYKTPRTYEFSAEDIRDEAGKVRRKALREARMK